MLYNYKYKCYIIIISAIYSADKCYIIMHSHPYLGRIQDMAWHYNYFATSYLLSEKLKVVQLQRFKALFAATTTGSLATPGRHGCCGSGLGCGSCGRTPSRGGSSRPHPNSCKTCAKEILTKSCIDMPHLVLCRNDPVPH